MKGAPACVIRAPAKVNLFLEVGGRRADGFHEIDTLFQAVSLWDAVRVERTLAGVDLRVDGPDLGPTESNLAVRAARAFLAELGSPEGVRIWLTKAIPAGAGLGGGSSDAAVVLRAMDALWDGSVGPIRLAELGAELGSDVPFFLGESPLARGRGRGEVLEPLAPLPPADLVLVLPPVHVATGGAYAALGRRSDGGVERATDVPFLAPSGWADVALMARNDFQEMVASTHPEVRSSLEALRDAGARPSLLSGSGAACFGVFPDQATAGAVAETMGGELGWPVRAVRTLQDFPAPQAFGTLGLEGPTPLG